jgi:3'-phosphoadenosine 5'-phosphosulfate (PAPS) 3'-phosphatase
VFSTLEPWSRVAVSRFCKIGCDQSSQLISRSGPRLIPSLRVSYSLVHAHLAFHALPSQSTMSVQQVNLLDLAAASIAASLAAARPIREYSGQGEEKKNARFKLDGSVVTDADFAAQGCIVRALRKVKGDFIIVGEESPEEMQKHLQGEDAAENDTIMKLAQVEVLNRYNGIEGCPLAEGDFPETLPDAPSKSDNAEILVDASRVRVFVDPLDGTKSYANGDYDAVTILIAVILDGKPHFGVITKPFGYKGHSSVLHRKCVTLYGGDLLQHVYFAGVQEACVIQTSDQLPRAVISSSRSEGVVRDFCDHLAGNHIVQSEPLEVSGAGEKSLRLIVGTENETLWFFPKKGTSRWDVAASDALLRAMGGKLTNKYGHDLDYLKSREEAENTEGIIASNDAALHEECIRIFNEGNWERKYGCED